MKNMAKLPEKYNVAATVATGMLDHWVTDNDNTAGECIKFLRANGLPVQTFVCLTRIQGYVRQAQERFDTPDQSHRIFDLLEIRDPALRPAYFKAFRNTLVS
jgi:structural maintenance of chromosome 4